MEVTKQDQIRKTQHILDDLGSLDGLKNSVCVDGTTVRLALNFKTGVVSQKVASIIARAINGSKEMDQLKREINKELRVLVNDIAPPAR